MKVFKYILGVIAFTLLMTGCSFKGHEYKVDMDTVNNLNDESLKPVSINKAKTVGTKNNFSLPLRAVNMTSPYGSSFSDYISKSLQMQLDQNSLINAQSDIKIDTKLLKNDVDIWGFSTASYDLACQFTITKNQKVLLDKTVEVKHIFPSHFVGQIAIENGMSNYPVAVKKLIATFLNDNQVIEVLK